MKSAIVEPSGLNGRLSAFCLRLGVLAGLAGMTMGLGMGVAEDFRLSTAHAHLNLLGWVSMFLYGLYYRSRSRSVGLPGLLHVVFASAGLIVFIPSLAMATVGSPAALPLASTGLKIASLIILIGMALFILVVVSAPKDEAPGRGPQGR